MAKKVLPPTRKERKLAERPPASVKDEKIELTAAEQQPEKEVVVKQRRLSPKDRVVMSVLLSVAIILIIVPIIILMVDRPLGINNPVAVIELDNGMTLEFELFYDDAPYAVSNFVHLVNKGIYNNTSVHKIENNQLLAGVYQTYISAAPVSPNNVDIYTRFKNKKDEGGTLETYKYKYYVTKTDNSEYKNFHAGYISVVTSNPTSNFFAPFRICLDRVDMTSDIYGTAFGYMRGEKTIENLAELKKYSVDSLKSPSPPLNIKSISIKADDRKWLTYDFFSDHTTDDYYAVAIA